MHMTFWWGYDFGDFFFNGATVQTVGNMILLCGIFTVIAIIYEGLKGLETKFHRENDMYLKQMTLGPCSDDRNNLLQNNDISEARNQNQASTRTFSLLNRFRTKAQKVLLYTANSTINYLVMLAIMLYNGYVFLAIIIGIAIGYFVFGLIGDYYNRKAIYERRKVGIVCEPECVENENRSTPPLLQRDVTEDRLTCEVQIESPCRKPKSDVYNEDINDDGAVTEKFIKKTTDQSKIKGKKTDCCVKSNTDDAANSCCEPQPGVTSTASSDELIQKDNTENLEINKDTND